MKTSRRLVENQFELWCKLQGYRVAESYKDVGAFQLNYAACYGGYNIELILSDAGAVTHPFGDKRRKPRDMVEFLESLITYHYHTTQNAKLFRKAEHV